MAPPDNWKIAQAAINIQTDLMEWRFIYLFIIIIFLVVVVVVVYNDFAHLKKIIVHIILWYAYCNWW
jgi:hypothetical protein